MSKNKNVGNLSLSTTVVARFLLFCAVLLALPAVAAAQCISQLTVQRVWTRDAAGNDKTTFAPGEAIQFAAELNNSYGGALLAANGTQLTITTSFYNDTKPVDIPPGISPWTWTATAPSTEGSYTVTVKAYDHFCGTFPEGSASFAVTSKPGGQLPSQIENPDPRLNSQPIFYPLGGTPPRAYDKLNPPPNAEHLVVIIHGWEPKGLEYDLSVENKMKSSIKKIIAEKRSSEKEKWYVKVWDWRSQAGPCIIDVDLSGLHLCANTAYSNATAQGEALSAEIGKYSFKDVHLIAHSAGSNVVQTAIDKLKGRPHLIFHATFLDAYAPSVDKLIYGIGANYAEHYVDKRGSIPWFSNTNQDLKNAYTFDVTALDETQFPPDYAIANPHLYLLYVHGWPTAWYQESIDSQGMESLIKFNYGFGLSRENGLDMLPTEFAPPGKCELLSDNDQCPTNIRQYILQPVFAGTKINPLLASLNGQTRQSSSGSVSYDDTGVLWSTGSPVWFEIFETITSVANFMKFDLEFLSSTGAEGIMIVFIDGQPVYKIDERITERGLNAGGVWVGDLSPGQHTIGFRLDPFTNVQSVARISKIKLGKVANTPTRIDFNALLDGTPTSDEAFSRVTVDGLYSPLGVNFRSKDDAGPTFSYPGHPFSSQSIVINDFTRQGETFNIVAEFLTPMNFVSADVLSAADLSVRMTAKDASGAILGSTTSSSETISAYPFKGNVALSGIGAISTVEFEAVPDPAVAGVGIDNLTFLRLHP